MNVGIELGKYIERKMEERELMLRKKGKIKAGRKLSRNYMAKEVLGVSGTWFSGVINGDNVPSDDLLIRIAQFLEIDEHEIFRVARRIHPTVLEQYRKEYLGKYYSPSTPTGRVTSCV
jgi:transcriptional regulator with XRE-family HTH domain